MDQKKYPNGKYTQVPNVFYETCDLPISAQHLYLRLYSQRAHIDGTFTGSLRQLCKAVRMSKGTVERMVKVLKESGLVNVDYDEGGQMVITLNIKELWDLNRYHTHVSPVPNWDTKMPDCPNLGQDCPDLGQQRPKLSQNCPNLGQNQAQDDAINNKPFNQTNIEGKNDATEPTTIKGIDILSSDQSFWFTNILLNSKIGPILRKKTITEQAKKYIEELMPCVLSVEQANSLYYFSEKMIQASKKEDKTVYLGNLAQYLPAWQQAQERAAAQSQNENPNADSSSADAKQSLLNNLCASSNRRTRLRDGRDINDKIEYDNGPSADVEDTEQYLGDRRVVDGYGWPVGEQVETG